MKEVTRDPKAWGEIAGAYDARVRALLTPFSEEAIRWAELDTTDDVLDVACGPGTTTLLAAVAARSVQALDFAPEMIAALEANATDLANVAATVGDGQDLPFDDASFTAAFSMFGLMFFPDPGLGLRELHRVLRPGGQVLISSWVPIEDSPMMMPLMQAMLAAFPPRDDEPPPEGFAFDNAAALETGLREAGFVDVQTRRFAPEIAIAGADDYWAVHGGNVFVNHLRKQAGADWPALESTILDHLRTTLHDVERLRMPSLLARARRP